MTTKHANISELSKAGTLLELSKVITQAKVLPVLIFKVGEYMIDADQVVRKIQSEFKKGFIVVRSSSSNEDGEMSNAGHYKSVLNVSLDDTEKIRSAISEVITSYKQNNSNEEIFVQPQLSNISLAGVAFTADLDTLAPYYIINYDESGSSDSVTSGRINDLKTFVFFKDSPIRPIDKRLNTLVTSLKELEAIFNHPFLDVEFAFDRSGELFIFQVRKISTNAKEDLSNIDLKETLLKIHKKINKLSSPHPNLLGDHAVYGVMPDWNPAEIIGLKPKYLAASLYKEIITDSIWAYQRDNYGYRNLRSHPLMLLYLGVPYIDVRVDFNSFIPKELHEATAKKLVEYYLNKLISKPVLHDKVEFEIVHSCFYFNLPEKLDSDLSKGGFSANEIKHIEESLLAITNKIIHPETGLYKKDILQSQKLEGKYQQVISSQLSLVDKIYWLIEDCKRFGTLPFAGIARSAFIATQFLRSFIELNIITKEEYNSFTASLNTITRTLSNDLFDYHNKKLSKDEFLKKYGHLRPGTYDILSKRYDENFDSYFSRSVQSAPVSHSNFQFSSTQLGKIDDLLKKYKLQISSLQLIEFIKSAIEGRENIKFIFSRSLSKALSLIEELALKYGVEKEDLVYLDIKTIIDLYASLDYRDVKEIFERDIEKNKRTYQFTKAVKLPGLISKADDVYYYTLQAEVPNYITLKCVCAETIQESELNTKQLAGKIVFIRSADPGYDFLFTKNIGGLITEFGGANSHMAVRCAELGIPAVIGAGESNYHAWSKAGLLEIDCLNNQVKIIS